MPVQDSSPFSGLFARIYFGVQQLRAGVSRDQIETARRLLDSSREALSEHVSRRLSSVHGAPDAALDWLDEQPLTDREQLREPMAVALEQESRRRIEIRKTSGSTGTPFRFVKDREMTAMMDAAMWASYGWHGIEPGLPHARFWGMPRDHLPRLRRRVMDMVLHRRRLDAFDLRPESAREFFHSLRKFQPAYVHTYPNLLLAFIKYCTDARLDGRDLGVSVVVCGGELLPPTSRATITEFFGARVVNEYGCSESGLLSIDCEYGQAHVLPVATYPQLIDVRGEKDGLASGEVVITDLYGAVLPLLRYRLHDRATMTIEDCPCGRALPLLSPVIGRIDSFIQTPEGPVYDAILAYSVPKDVLRFRVYQIEPDYLFVEAILSPSAPGDEALRKLESVWVEELGARMHVRAVAVDALPTMESGKLAYFVPLGEVSEAVRQRAKSE